GQLTGHRAGHTLVLAAAEVHALADARRNGHTGWDPPAGSAVEVPDLLSTTEAADQLGLAQRNWVGELYRRGQIPGRTVGRRNVVFAAETITDIAEERRIGLHHYLHPQQTDD